jgi:hypothetical protein
MVRVDTPNASGDSRNLLPARRDGGVLDGMWKPPGVDPARRPGMQKAQPTAENW